MKDFYYILGTDTNCSSIEIKEAYRKLSKKFHPDLNQNDKYFESRFREIQEAYEVLNDPFKRKQYDAALNKFKTGQNAHTSASEKYKATPSISNRTRMAIDIIFTIILILITCIFGDYVIKAMNAPDHSKAKQITEVITPEPIIKTKHHKKKHGLNTQIVDAIPKQISPTKPAKSDTTKIQQLQAARVETKPVKIIAVNNGFLYTTMVKANVTGIVNMREQDNLSSEIVTSIPNYSQVDVLEKGDRYYKVRYNSNTGYVPKWTLQVK
ncbi:SH3 domain-containing protein [Mucilaginibacter sp. L196]|uniref:SH3 domain-containing protein n=1 Tax=Mucilaginibacter sp. L196 TaxID=1641870 RepID=UPI00131C26D9|nr:SH3 domain-containing protein [Mucilaginibacter sp. L196]